MSISETFLETQTRELLTTFLGLVIAAAITTAVTLELFNLLI